MARRAVNIYVEQQVLDQIKPLLPNRSLSKFVTHLLKSSMAKLESDPGFWRPKKACHRSRKEDNRQS